MTLFADSAEHSELRDMVRSFLAERMPRHSADSAETRTHAWRDLVDLGLVGLLVPEDIGGQGGSLDDALVVLQETGASLAALPVVGTTAVLGALMACGSAAGRETAADLCRTGSAAALALAETRWSADLVQPTTVAERAGDGVVISGTKRYVIDAAAADIVVVSALWDGRPELFAIRPGAGVNITAHPTLDQTRSLATIVLDGAPGQRVSSEDHADVAGAADLLYTLLAAESVGAAGRCLSMTVQHLRDRVQFGRPLGTFQALQHRCADRATALDAATASLAHAAGTWGTPAHRVAAPLAFAVAMEAFSQTAAEMVQMHGGIGFTWEHEAHLYFKRAASTELVFGPSRRLRRLVAGRAGLFDD